MIKKQNYNEIVNGDKIANAIVNTEFIGFEHDYYIIHCLLAEWKPNHIFEIGTNTGNGCRIMHNASPNSKITTLDIREKCGEYCPSIVTKICGDSMTFDFTPYYPIDCWFIDGEHEYPNSYKETKEALKSGAKYIIYHDADLKKVTDGFLDAFKDENELDNYDIYQVINPPFIYSSSRENVTRISYAIKK